MTGRFDSYTVGDRIRAALAVRRLSGAWLARELGRTDMWVSRRLNGQSPLSVDDLVAIAALLELDPRDLLSGEAA